jgi:phage-related tail protein
MADLNQEAQELAEIMERVNEEMRRYGRITEETAEALKAGSDKRAKELQASGKATADALGAVAKAGMAAASAMYQGEKGAAAFNNSLDSMADAAATAAGVALTFLIPGGPAH